MPMSRSRRGYEIGPIAAASAPWLPMGASVALVRVKRREVQQLRVVVVTAACC